MQIRPSFPSFGGLAETREAFSVWGAVEGDRRRAWVS